MGTILAEDWDAKAQADRVLDGLVTVTEPGVKGAHDSDLLVTGGKAYVVYMANTEKPGENPIWPFVQVKLSVVDLESGAVEVTLPVAKGGQAFANESLPTGACFVPRLIQRGDSALRCFFASEDPGNRQSQTWYRDLDLTTLTFADRIERTKLVVDGETVDMEPQALYGAAAERGFQHPEHNYGLYMVDSFKVFDGVPYAVVNNFPIGQHALARLNESMDTLEVMGHFNEPFHCKYTEAAVNRLPDGRWLAICRREDGDQNYGFAESVDGNTWSAIEERGFVQNGGASKPTFDRFGDLYYLGWQDGQWIGGVYRTIFNIDVSRNGEQWERKYRFETPDSFQYPVFRSDGQKVYLSVTQGTESDCRKQRISFGMLGVVRP